MKERGKDQGVNDRPWFISLGPFGCVGYGQKVGDDVLRNDFRSEPLPIFWEECKSPEVALELIFKKYRDLNENGNLDLEITSISKEILSFWDTSKKDISVNYKNNTEQKPEKSVLRIKNCSFSRDINLDNWCNDLSPFYSYFYGCDFYGKFIIKGSILGDFQVDCCKFHDLFQYSDSISRGEYFILMNSDFSGIKIEKTEINKKATISSCNFGTLSTGMIEAEEYPFLYKCDTGSVSIVDCTINLKLNMSESYFGGSFSFARNTIKKDINFKESYFGSTADFKNIRIDNCKSGENNIPLLRFDYSIFKEKSWFRNTNEYRIPGRCLAFRGVDVRDCVFISVDWESWDSGWDSINFINGIREKRNFCMFMAENALKTGEKYDYPEWKAQSGEYAIEIIRNDLMKTTCKFENKLRMFFLSIYKMLSLFGTSVSRSLIWFCIPLVIAFVSIYQFPNLICESQTPQISQTTQPVQAAPMGLATETPKISMVDSSPKIDQKTKAKQTSQTYQPSQATKWRCFFTFITNGKANNLVGIISILFVGVLIALLGLLGLSVKNKTKL